MRGCQIAAGGITRYRMPLAGSLWRPPSESVKMKHRSLKPAGSTSIVTLITPKVLLWGLPGVPLTTMDFVRGRSSAVTLSGSHWSRATADTVAGPTMPVILTPPPKNTGGVFRRPFCWPRTHTCTEGNRWWECESPCPWKQPPDHRRDHRRTPLLATRERRSWWRPTSGRTPRTE